MTRSDPLLASSERQADATPFEGDTFRAAPRRLEPMRLVRGRLGVLGLHARFGSCLALLFVCGWVVRAVMAASGGLGRAGLGPLAEATGWLAVGLGLGAAFTLPLLLVRRLHDLGHRGGWWWLSLVPIVNVFLHLYMMFWPGEPAANRFGDAPRPGRAERAIGCVGLVLFSTLLFGTARRLHSGPPVTPSHPSPWLQGFSRTPHEDATARYEDAMARFAAAEPRAERIVDAVAFRRLVVGRAAVFVSEGVEAAMRFDADGKLHGTFVRPNEAPETAAFLWRWRDGRLCREGTIGTVRIPAACGVVGHVPGVGLLVEPDDVRLGAERWLLD